MARTERFFFSHSRKIESAHRYASEAHQEGAILKTGQSGNGRYVTVDGARLLSFGSCSYMGLETMPQLRDCAHHALDEYGTQFHFSRAYLQCQLYLELESLLEQIAGRPALVAASTSLAHMAALPVLVDAEDHIVIDQFAHASLHTALHLLPNVPQEILRHNRMDHLDALLTRLAKGPGKVWYVADGLYSMLGDFAPFEELKRLLDRHPHLRLYIDDAHSTSWFGKHGRGAALEHFADDERVVVVLSLNKAFSAAGGALTLPRRDVLMRIRRCGGPMLFSGPIQPPMLGAGVGSARLHLSEDFPAMQAELTERLDCFSSAIASHGLDVASATRTPIFQAQCDSPRIAFKVVTMMQRKGYHCCVCVFPAVPMNRPGVRFTASRHNQLEDIPPFVRALTESVQEATHLAPRREGVGYGSPAVSE